MSTTPPTDEAVVSISGVAPVTLTVSASAATFSVKSIVERLRDVDRDVLAVDTVAKPAARR